MIQKIIKHMFKGKTREKEYKINGVPVKVEYSPYVGSGKSRKTVKFVVQDMPKSKKDKYVLSSIYPNEEVMRRVDKILLESSGV